MTDLGRSTVLALLLAGAALPTSAYGLPINVGTGADGDKAVSSGTFYVDSVKTSLASASGDILTVGTTTGFAPGDEVLVIGLQNSGDSSAGKYEFAYIASVDGVNERLYLETSLGQTFSGSDRVVVQRVPQYRDVTVSGTGAIGAAAWNGVTGGVIAFRVQGTLTVGSSARISADSLGFAGGSAGTTTSTTGRQGESYGDGSEALSRSANWGGGGGGMEENGAGPYDIAHGGGGGGHGVAGGAGSYSNSFNANGLGGAVYGGAAMSTLHLGSGGGGGGGDDASWVSDYGNGGAGGKGGGIIYIAADTMDIAGQIYARGASGGSAQDNNGTGDAGGGGGGSGGTIYLLAETATISLTPSVAGGTGGSSTSNDVLDSVRKGGNGGAGYYLYQQGEATIPGSEVPEPTALALLALGLPAALARGRRRDRSAC